MPSSVTVPFDSEGNIDCAAWTQALEAQSSTSAQYATLLYDDSLTPIIDIFAYGPGSGLVWPTG